MHGKHRRLRTYGTIAAFVLLGGAVGLPSAAATVDPAPIGANQFFNGQVNGASASAVIRVVCPVPATVGETGHPIAGQTVDVVPGASSTSAVVGYTGSAGTHVNVEFGTASANAPVTLSSYAVQAAIPTTLNLPCSGTGKVAFVPSPTSTTAQTATVAVTYADIAAS
ncbi:hypothetical protein POF50_003230 [Streptomyces sp. SL13]|uniref:Uncharacterized protein n=1 Tax=Streptantibioticus silvisoli TaxID=2705255 RepID=A0AA90KES9_9ACTN|nr:hypothetical protein [Streptantibioticus silvisoli]MDI5968370.1 hypothetical protein [Streptantibioticus silvisoli]